MTDVAANPQRKMLKDALCWNLIDRFSNLVCNSNAMQAFIIASTATQDKMMNRLVALRLCSFYSRS
ncbi:hypothetical protein SAY86_013133 [Trapa natans]|uniref:Uncharacterized protein n=1 Tax=Trapa natans TaxID=22666 RepID=A0AAN7R7U4_TRANT|nr:hypothetical protein SAY86_013133 [Trapa natans]